MIRREIVSQQGDGSFGGQIDGQNKEAENGLRIMKEKGLLILPMEKLISLYNTGPYVLVHEWITIRNKRGYQSMIPILGVDYPRTQEMQFAKAVDCALEGEEQQIKVIFNENCINARKMKLRVMDMVLRENMPVNIEQSRIGRPIIF